MCEEGTVMDLIYRQTILDALAEINKEVEDGDGFQYEKWREYFAEMTSPAQLQSGGDTISRQAAIDEIDEWIKAFLESGHKESAADACLIQDGIIQLPSAQPDLSSYSDKLWRAAYERGKAEAQPKRGMWIKSDTDAFVCSACRNGYKNQPTIMGKPMFEYCPCCGARMDGGDQDE